MRNKKWVITLKGVSDLHGESKSVLSDSRLVNGRMMFDYFFLSFSVWEVKEKIIIDMLGLKSL